MKLELGSQVIFGQFLRLEVFGTTMAAPIRQADLEAYLDEALPADQMARVERALRNDEELLAKLKAIHSRRDSGVHTLGEIWRRHRLSCPSRQRLGNYLLGALSDDEEDYIVFHLETIGCRYCRASLTDLQKQQAEAHADVEQRRRKYFQSSAGLLKKK